MIGERLSRYRILSKLGAGGMGEVYLAEDTELGRQVAVKVLPDAVSTSPERLERFRREARAIAALDHPNIVTIFNVEEVDGRRLLVMEHVEGKSLRQLIPRDGLPLERVFEVAVPLTEALAAAHEKGITHRDLKPANVMVTPQGTVKVLDFGLAKLTRDPSDVSPEAPTEAAPDAHSLTAEGGVVGTAPYMSPEQLSGKPVDQRSDLFSLGILLYEMVVGKRPFQGDTGIELASSILKDEPSSVTEARRDAPRQLGRIIEHCLEKDPQRRFQSVKDLRYELEGLAQELSPPSASSSLAASLEPAARPSGEVQWRAWLLGFPLMLLLSAVTLWWFMREGPLDNDGTEPRVVEPIARARDDSEATFAVIPLRNMGADESLDYLRVAVPDEITTTLSRASGLAVRPFSMTADVAADSLDPVETGRELGVETLITGQYLREGQRLNLSLEAIDVARNVVVWRTSLAVSSQELIALRDSVSATVETDLLPALGLSAAQTRGTSPSNEAAYDLYLRSISYNNEAGPTREALALLERSLELDPDYAPAWSELATRLQHQGAYHLVGINDRYDRAEAAARRALVLDPDLVEPMRRLIIIAVERGKLDEAWDAATELLSRRPDSGQAYFARSYVLRYAGAVDEAVADCDAALARDPHNPGFRSCGITNSLVGRQERAILFLELAPGSTFYLDNLAMIRIRQGRASDAAVILREMSSARPLGDWFRIPFAQGLEGEAPSADAVGALVSRATGQLDIEQPYWHGSILAYVGELEAGLGLVREGIERGYCAPFLETDPMLDPVRAEPRLAAEYSDTLAAARACSRAFRAHAGL